MDLRQLGFSAVMLLFVMPSLAAAQHFGLFTKETVTLHRKLPSVFPLTGTQVSVKVTPGGPNTALMAGQLGPMIEVLLQQNDPRVSIDNTNPQTLITCTVSGYIPPNIVKSVGAPITTKKGTTPGAVTYRVTGNLVVSYTAKDVKTNKSLDASVLESKIDRVYDDAGNKEATSITDTIKGLGRLHQGRDMPTTPADVNQIMVKEIAGDVTRRVVTTDESIQVPLPKGKLEKAAKFAQSGAWSRMLEAVESTPPFDKPSEESYRLYDIGLAYEGMGYGASDPKQALNLFEQASINYGKALDTNPNDKTMRVPPNRIQEALVILRTIEERKAGAPVSLIAQKAEPRPESKADLVTVTSPKPNPKAEDDNTLTNDGIIELKKSGMDDDNLLANIHDAKQVKFDLTISGQKQLMQAGVSNTVLAAMRQKSKAGSTAPRPRRASALPVAASSH